MQTTHTDLKRTALFEEHKKLGGKLIDFGGWEMPVQYTGVIEEHLGCRQSLGIFDVSHMGEIQIEGENSEPFLHYLLTNDIKKLNVHQAQYNLLCNAQGGIVDDLVVYRQGKDKFLLVVNASNTDKDFKHIQQIYQFQAARFPAVQIQNVSSAFTQIALQGRNAQVTLQELTDTPLGTIKNYWFLEGKLLNQVPTLLARTGYTGEDGFEIYLPWSEGPFVWHKLLEVGNKYQIKPCGLGARDTLRLEMKYPLYGNELDDQTPALEAGLGWVVKFDKEDFLGKTPLLKLKNEGLKKKLVGFKLLERGIARHGYPIFINSSHRPIGGVTSGTQSPSLKQSIGIAFVDTPYSQEGTKILVEIRGNKVSGEVTPTPFYKRNY